jgi:hypothetical protein
VLCLSHTDYTTLMCLNTTITHPLAFMAPSLSCSHTRLDTPWAHSGKYTASYCCARLRLCVWVSQSGAYSHMRLAGLSLGPSGIVLSGPVGSSGHSLLLLNWRHTLPLLPSTRLDEVLLGSNNIFCNRLLLLCLHAAAAAALPAAAAAAAAAAAGSMLLKCMLMLSQCVEVTRQCNGSQKVGSWTCLS